MVSLGVFVFRYVLLAGSLVLRGTRGSSLLYPAEINSFLIHRPAEADVHSCSPSGFSRDSLMICRVADTSFVTARQRSALSEMDELEQMCFCVGEDGHTLTSSSVQCDTTELHLWLWEMLPSCEIRYYEMKAHFSVWTGRTVSLWLDAAGGSRLFFNCYSLMNQSRDPVY